MSKNFFLTNMLHSLPHNAIIASCRSCLILVKILQTKLGTSGFHLFTNFKWLAEIEKIMGYQLIVTSIRSTHHKVIMTSSNGTICSRRGQRLIGIALVFSLICVWINDWVNNREAGDLRRYRTHYRVIVMVSLDMIKCIGFLSVLNAMRNLNVVHVVNLRKPLNKDSILVVIWDAHITSITVMGC